MTGARTAALVAGVAGPAAFVGAWVAGGLATAGYSPVEQAISQLARQGAPTRPLMTAGFLAFGALVPLYARELGRELGPGAGVAAAASGLATLAVAALPLSRETMQPVDSWHAVAAGTGYAAQVLAPLLAARALRQPWARRASYAVSGVAAASLVGSIAVPDVAGLLQRTGLTVVDAWFVAVAVALLGGRRLSNVRPPA